MSKRPPSPTLIANPFIKKRNLEWALESPQRDHTKPVQRPASAQSSPTKPATTAAIESGEALITDHLAHFTTRLSQHITQSSSPTAYLPISEYASLYSSNAGSRDGAHFVIHQHDHPVAGTHYDLRLQINESSSVSWAIMYGLPGDANSVRLLRNATETRIHCLWNHLIETASAATGSLLIWDTGTYTILPRESKHAPASDPSSPPRSPSPVSPPSQQSLLHAAFQDRKIRLRLHGQKLPDPYVLNLRLTQAEDIAGRAHAARVPGRRRVRRAAKAAQPETSDEEDASRSGDDDDQVVAPSEEAGADVSAMERELRELEDAQVRRTNAYPGADNSIGSVHQRKWFLSLDRKACGFAEGRRGGRTVWEPGEGASQGESGERLAYPFYVRGVEHERSVVTGRRGEDVMRDEGVTDFVARKGWKAVLS